MREFTVIPVLNGFIVNVGCKTLVFASNEALEKAIHDYITESDKTTKRFLTTSLHSDMDTTSVYGQRISLPTACGEGTEGGQD